MLDCLPLYHPSKERSIEVRMQEIKVGEHEREGPSVRGEGMGQSFQANQWDHVQAFRHTSLTRIAPADPGSGTCINAPYCREPANTDNRGDDCELETTLKSHDSEAGVLDHDVHQKVQLRPQSAMKKKKHSPENRTGIENSLQRGSTLQEA